jgi:transcription-repair coupling factor (superfamily II helicase)
VDRNRAYIPTKGYNMQVDAVGTSWMQLARAALHIG